MQERFPTFFLVLGCILLTAVFIVWRAVRPAAPSASTGEDAPRMHLSSKGTPSTLGLRTPGESARNNARLRGALADYEKSRDLDALLADPSAIPGEAILRFRTPAALDAFRRAAAKAGINLLGAIPGRNLLRVGYGDLAALESALSGLDSDDYGAAPNYPVVIPGVPEPGSAQDPGTPLPAFGRRTFDFLGIEGDISGWGAGIRVAILDSQVLEHSTFTAGQVRDVAFLDAGAADNTVAPGDASGHGTAVASIVAGNDPSALGLAPAAEILSFAITDASGVSDSFTLSQAIFAAVDGGADLINISLGSYGDSFLVREAVAYAQENSVPIIAAAGNEGYSQLAFPAAYEGVIGVGAVDASGQHVYFSNTGEGLSLAAPGVGVYAAWPGDDQVNFSGTSASAPFVTGELAALMSTGLGATEAIEVMNAYANEAGRPGYDDQFGSGIINLGRAMERGNPGIFDVAIASQSFADPVIASNNANQVIDIAVQNRGTEPLYNVRLEVLSGTISRS
ncbi:MAG: S8 family serine peptidase, partial [Verrucomicrobiales bacterium]